MTREVVIDGLVRDFVPDHVGKLRRTRVRVLQTVVPKFLHFFESQLTWCMAPRRDRIFGTAFRPLHDAFESALANVVLLGNARCP